jgi:spermidine synthase
VERHNPPRKDHARKIQVMLLTLFIVNSFVCAALLFWLQPMFARMVLPLLGGSPSVWITALLFYQAVLLTGYSYAHGSLQLLGVRRQAWLHIALLALPLLFLPIVVPDGWVPPADRDPTPWLLGLLGLGVGVPFFVIATSSPVLQRWFSTTSHGIASDPYLLYAASNAGSVLALLTYPLWIEPALTLEEQSRWWSRGYALAAALSIGCALVALRHTGTRKHGLQTGTTTVALPGSPTEVAGAVEPITPHSADRPEACLQTAGRPGSNDGKPDWRVRGFWLLLAFIPCSLMLSTTTFITTDLASVPLLWVIPLTLYLVSFILVFSRLQLLPHWLMARMFPLFACAMVIILATRSNEPMILIMPINFITLFLAAMVCHHGLAATRPPPRYLTEFYLFLSCGGVLGGVFNALIAPFVFTQVAEHPIGLTLACGFGLLGTDRARYQAVNRADFAIPVGIGCLASLLLLALHHGGRSELPETKAMIRTLLLGIPTVLCFLAVRRPVRFGLGLGAVLLVGYWSDSGAGRIVYAERSFYGVHRVTTDHEERFYRLLHGNTFHGMQSRNPDQRAEPLAYYHRNGPAGHIFTAIARSPHDRFAMVGLGVGSLAAYGRPTEQWHFYEIDPAVERIARDARFFTFLEDSPATIQVILGDARLSLQNAPDDTYRLIVLDAYSSDAIPVHLLTREALQLYRDKLAPGGWLAFHISNVHLDLAPVVANLAHDAGLVLRMREDAFVSEAELADGLFPSKWVLMAEQEESFAPLLHDLRWEAFPAQEKLSVWTDNYSSLMDVLRWRPTRLPHWVPGQYR